MEPITPVPPPGTNVVLVIADSANATPPDRINLLGAGWRVARTPVPSHLVVSFMTLIPTAKRRTVTANLQLLDDDGQLVRPALGAGQVRAKQDVTIPAWAPSKPGAPVDMHWIWPIPSLVLEPGSYSWVLTVDGCTAQRSFDVIA